VTLSPWRPGRPADGGSTDRAILANTPFNVKHGFVLDPESTPSEIQQSSIDLYVDGAKQRGTIIQEFSGTKPPTLTAKWSLFNFPNGLAPGTYVLRIAFGFRGQIVLTRDMTIYSLPSCVNGTTDGLLCAPPPPPT
jgi:hypothetical protein